MDTAIYPMLLKSKRIAPSAIVTGLLLFFSVTSQYFSINVPVFGTMRVFLSFLLLVLVAPTLKNRLIQLRKRGLLAPLILFVIYIPISSYLSGSGQSVNHAFLWLNNAIFFILLYSVISSSNTLELSLIVVFFSFGLILTGIFYASSYIPLLSSISFPIVEGSSHQASAQSAMLSLIIALLLTTNAFPKFVKLYGIVILLISVIVLIISGARTPALSAIVVLLAWRKSLKWIILLAISIPLIFSITASFANLDWAINRVERLYIALRTSEVYSISEIEFRANNVELALQAFYNSPFFGIGYGHWQTYSSQNQNIIGQVLAAHNGWANGLSELGLVGMMIYLLFLYRSFSHVKWKESYDLPEAIHRVGFLGICSLFVLSIGGNALLQRTMLIFAAISAAGKDYYFPAIGKVYSKDTATSEKQSFEC